MVDRNKCSYKVRVLINAACQGILVYTLLKELALSQA